MLHDISGYTGLPVHLVLERGIIPELFKAPLALFALISVVADEFQQLKPKETTDPVQHSEWGTPECAKMASLSGKTPELSHPETIAAV